MLSASEEAAFHFHDGNVDISATVRRTEFETWIAPDLQAIDGAVTSLLAQTRIDPAQIDRVFLTGGMDKIQSGDEFTSIAQGLALKAEGA